MARKSNSGWVALALALFGGALVLGGSSTKAEAKENALQGRIRRLYGRAAALLGIQPPPLVFTADVDNAASDGSRVLVNLKWFETMLRRFCDHHSCSEVVVLGILAHELAHHINKDAFSSLRDRKSRELRADSWAGVVLARAGVEPCDFERVLNELSSRNSSTHPAGPDRVLAIRLAYLKTRGN